MVTMTMITTAVIMMMEKTKTRARGKHSSEEVAGMPP